MDQNTDKTAAKPKVMYQVFDSAQRGEVGRPHEIITKWPPADESGARPDPETTIYRLFSEKATEMPVDHAMKFLSDGTFRVLKPDGTRVMPVTPTDVSRPIKILGDDEIVAKYSDLSRDTLFRMVKVRPGSEGIPENAKHGELVDFMLAWRKSLKGMTQSDRDLAEKMAKGELGGAMTGGMLDTMFGDKKIAAA